MANRHTLAIHKLDEFKEWLDCTDVQYRDTTAPYQVLQVRLPDDPRWHAIYQKLHAKEHLSVPEPLVKLVQEFIEYPLDMHRRHVDTRPNLMQVSREPGQISPTGRLVEPYHPPFHNFPPSDATPPWE